MFSVASILGGLAAIGILAGTAFLAFKAGKFWGATRDSAKGVSTAFLARNAPDDATNLERYVRRKVVDDVVTPLVADGTRTERLADILRDVADDLDDDAVDGGDVDV